MSTLPVVDASAPAEPDLSIDTTLVANWLTAFLHDELVVRRRISRAVLGLSGGVDSAVVAYLAVRALGAGNVTAIRMPYRSSSPDSLGDAQAVIDDLGCETMTLDISGAVDGYLTLAPDADGRRRGNVMARVRMLALFDQSARLGALPLGTGNKTERLMGYFTWHADDSPPLNPIGDLYKTQVWALARELGVPSRVVTKAPSADLEANQTDETDLGITYLEADRILALMLAGYPDDRIAVRGHEPEAVALVRRRVESTHWKRHLPTTAMLSDTSINDYYLRPVDF